MRAGPRHGAGAGGGAGGGARLAAPHLTQHQQLVGPQPGRGRHRAAGHRGAGGHGAGASAGLEDTHISRHISPYLGVLLARAAALTVPGHHSVGGPGGGRQGPGLVRQQLGRGRRGGARRQVATHTGDSIAVH